jgi:phospholipid transport system substrate-binding protein
MIFTRIFMSNISQSRRNFTVGLLAASAAGFAALPQAALAFSSSQAEALITKAVADITSIINSGKAESTMLRDFETVLVRYADMSSIARSALGPTARTASASELAAFTSAFQTYIAKKYGARFREFIGGDIKVNSTQKVNSIYDVRCTASLRGQSPFAISFIVADRSGKFIDLTIEGISLLKSERTEIGALLDKSGGSISALTKRLR